MLLLVAAGLVAGCGGAAKRPSVARPLTAATLAARVPADTPYAFLSLEPLPDGEARRWYRQVANRLARKASERQRALETGGPIERYLLALVERFEEDPSRAGVARLGFGRTPAFVVYGTGPHPTLRLAVTDAAAVQALLDAAAVRAGVKLAEDAHEGTRYRWLAGKGSTLVVALGDGELVAGLVPSAGVRSFVGAALGPGRGRGGLRERAAALARARGYRPDPFGFFETTPFVRSLVGVRGACADEAAVIGAVAPRVILAYQALGEERSIFDILVELGPELRADLAALQVDLPTLGTAGKPLASMGFALDLGRASEVARARLVSARIDFRCPDLAFFGGMVAWAKRGLVPPVGGGLAGLKGVNMVLESVTSRGEGPTDLEVTASVVVRHETPEAVLTWLRRNPGLEGVSPAPGQPTPLPLPGLFPRIFPAATLVVQGDVVAAAAGPGGVERARALPAAPAGSARPFVTVKVDGARLGPLLARFGLADETLSGYLGGTVELVLFLDERGLVGRLDARE